MSCPVCGAELEPARAFAAAGLECCTACGLHVSAVEDDAGAGRATYADDRYLAARSAVQWHEVQRRHEARVRLRWMRRWLAQGELFEVGAAAGWFLDEAARSGYRVRGVEPSPRLSDHARRVAGRDVATGYAEDIATVPSADAACLWHVLEHGAQPVTLLRAAAAQLRPGGLVFVEVPNIASPAAQRMGSRWSSLEAGFHLVHFTPGALRAGLERAGLVVLRIESVPAATYLRPVAWADPRRVLGALRAAWRARAAFRTHPWRGELLRAVAQRPAPVAGKPAAG
ncbi:MAG: class I SAM-dependent methyltransferase [Solirubrobacteraceae bacterium]|nr:class I SAM-dependent methyltransferase [Solirubrobacteraceae bacterium]